MKKKIVLCLLFVALLLAAMPVHTWAIGPYQPPTLTVVVLGAPAGTEMSVILHKGDEVFHSPIECERRAWESYYRIYRAGVWQIKDWYGNAYDFKDAELLIKNSEGEKLIPIPDGLLQPRGFDETITLRYDSGTLSYGLPVWRSPLLVGIRVLVALLIEGIFFFFKGFTEKKSWLVFFLINIVIHGALNVFCNGWINVNPSIYAVFYLVVFVSFLLETAGFLMLVDEYSSDRIISYLVPANLCSHAVNLLLMNYLPI